MKHVLLFGSGIGSVVAALAKAHVGTYTRRNGSVVQAHDTRVEAHGVQGMKSKPWRKEFKSSAHLDAWMTKQDGNAELHGVREMAEPKASGGDGGLNADAQPHRATAAAHASASAKLQGKGQDLAANQHDNAANLHVRVAQAYESGHPDAPKLAQTARSASYRAHTAYPADETMQSHKTGLKDGQ